MSFFEKKTDLDFKVCLFLFKGRQKGGQYPLGVGMIHGAHGHDIINPSNLESLKVRFWSPFKRVTTSAASPKRSE